ncbi:CshA/CshB family fibrillar adhesin-related protein [Dyadobacter sp. 676]|uniref:CshA/CshB family fibrillar adhesin-related protein n=1 Tax=Dyadobacter sp. 676 TaxID=3088362 RepID=A0AAU8FFY3_9BACT
MKEKLYLQKSRPFPSWQTVSQKAARLACCAMLPASLLLSYGNVQGQAVRATGGTGANRSTWWLDFSSMGEIAAGATVDQSFTVNGVDITVLIDQISFEGSVETGHTLAEQRLIAYTPGGWQGDGFDNMYNIGGPNAANTLTPAISSKYTGDYPGTGLMSITRFRLRAYATLNGLPVDLAFLFANAEDDYSSTNGVTTEDEYEQASTNGSPWRISERKVDAEGTLAYKKLTFWDNNQSVRISAGATPGQYTNGGNVAIMATRKEATSAVNPLESNIVLVGAGRGAIALGIAISIDHGDAPSSYGDAENFYLATGQGGNPANTTIHDEYLSEGGSAPAGSIVIAPSAGILDPLTPRLGTNRTDPDPAGAFSVEADGDNAAGRAPNDEDALAAIPTLNAGSSTYSITVPYHSSTVTNYITGWVDFNRDGIFTASEFASATVPPNTDGDATLTWTGINPVEGKSYIRLRISEYSSGDPANDLPGTPSDDRCTMVLNYGETEDYTFSIQPPLPVTLTAFTAKAESGTAVLSWSTTAEANSAYFEIERSLNGKQWSAIGRVDATGESSVLKHYTFTDISPLGGENLYRLKMTDQDATYAYSGIRSIRFDKREAALYPNPVTNKFRLNADNLHAIRQVQLIDLTGREVLRQDRQVQNDFPSEIDLTAIPAGIYLVRITHTDDTVRVVRIVKR